MPPMDSSKTTIVFFLFAFMKNVDLGAAEVDTKKLDLAFVVDGSGSICSSNVNDWCPNWGFMLRFIHNIVESLMIGEEATRVGLLTFSTSTVIQWHLDRFAEKVSLLQAIGKLRFPDGSTFVATALRNLTSKMFPASRDDRPDALKVAIIITDGQPSDSMAHVQQAIDDVHSRGIRTLVVGITNGITEDTLRLLSSDPKQQNVTYFMAKDFNSITLLERQLLDTICEAKTSTGIRRSFCKKRRAKPTETCCNSSLPVLNGTITNTPVITAVTVGDDISLGCKSSISSRFPSWTFSQHGVDDKIIAASCRIDSVYSTKYVVVKGESGQCNLTILKSSYRQVGVYKCIDDFSFASFSSLVVILGPLVETSGSTDNGLNSESVVQYVYDSDKDFILFLIGVAVLVVSFAFNIVLAACLIRERVRPTPLTALKYVESHKLSEYAAKGSDVYNPATKPPTDSRRAASHNAPAERSDPRLPGNAAAATDV